MKRAAFVVLACGVAAAAPAEWHIDAPAGWTASEQPADELVRAMPGAIAATSMVYTSTLGTLAVVGMVVRADGDPSDAIEAIERANRKTVARETRYESADVDGRHVVSQDIAVGNSMLYRRRIYTVGNDRAIHFVDASCEGAVETCGAALASLELRVEPVSDSIGWLIARIVGGVVAIALAGWLATKFRRR